MRYYVIEMWENLPDPIFVCKADDSGEVFTTNNIIEAEMHREQNCQDGYVLDFETMKIIKPA